LDSGEVVSVAEFKTSPRLRRKAGLKRIATLLEELRALSELREGRPGTFRLGSLPFLHFHYHPDGKIVADVRLSDGGFTHFDVSEEDEQPELISAVLRCLGEPDG